MSNEGYLLDNRRTEARVRFEAIAALFDAWTFAHIERLGIQPGWRCWEVGAGGANVPTWLAGRGARVLATDIDVRWAEEAASEVIEVRRHDVVNDPAPDGPFDLVHARLLLVHLPEREAVLRTLVGALRPGGWLLIEDADPALQPLACLEERGPEEALANRIRRGIRTLLAERGADLAFGRRLPAMLRAAGLADVQADAYFPVIHPAAATLEAATIQHVRAGLLARELATAEELDRNLAALASGRLDLVIGPMISAWGRKPAAS